MDRCRDVGRCCSPTSETFEVLCATFLSLFKLWSLGHGVNCCPCRPARADHHPAPWRIRGTALTKPQVKRPSAVGWYFTMPAFIALHSPPGPSNLVVSSRTALLIDPSFLNPDTHASSYCAHRCFFWVRDSPLTGSSRSLVVVRSSVVGYVAAHSSHPRRPDRRRVPPGRWRHRRSAHPPPPGRHRCAGRRRALPRGRQPSARCRNRANRRPGRSRCRSRE